MSVVEKNRQSAMVDNKKPVVVQNVSANESGTEDAGDKKASKVSKLREMFQTGSVRPVEDWDKCEQMLTEEQIRLLRTCPGSPPLLSLRSHRSDVAPVTTISAKQTATVANGAGPPKRPPKPKDLLLKSGLTPRHLLPAVRSKISPRLWTSISLFEGGAVVDDRSTKLKTTTSIVVKSESPGSAVPAASFKSKTASPIPTRSTTTAGAVADQSTVGPQPPPPKSVAKSVLPPDNAAASPVKSEYKDSVKVDANDVPSSLSTEVSACISLPEGADLSGIGDGDFQHAEPIAVATPDEDEDEEPSAENEMALLGLTTVQQFEPPPGLKVVAVDSLGVHILEDGHFFYAIPGVCDRSDSTKESSFLNTDSPVSSIPKALHPEDSSLDGSSAEQAGDLSWPNSSDGNKNKHVRFSSEPILIFSTHSTSEYDRKNDEVDPISASAAYELEKRLETMDLIEVDVRKTEQGLGLSIVGVGLDLDGGEKLGIFIKGLTPGGAAEACGKIKPNDQIVEVNGINLVGVSYDFAAQTMRGAGELVHFVLGRATDATNPWMLADQDEQEGSDDPPTTSPNPRQCPEPRPNSLSRDDSFETLQKMFSDADKALRMNENGDALENHDSVDFAADDSTELDVYATPVAGDQVTRMNGARKTSDCDQLASPRSALKGTATAASTKRRHDAIAHLIKLASDKAEKECASDVACSPDCLNAQTVQWILASDLYDCQCQVLKLQSQVQTLEQRLTAQEAAADEAIERLCMQCRHLESELHEAHDRLRQYVYRRDSAQNSSVDAGSPFQISSRSPRSFPIFNGSPTNNMDARLPPLGFSPQIESGRIGDRCVEKPSANSDTLQQTNNHMTVDSVSSSSSSPSSNDDRPADNQGAFTQLRSRIRLLSSGGLAGRHPRSRLEINPPPFGLINSTAISNPIVLSPDLGVSSNLPHSTALPVAQLPNTTTSRAASESDSGNTKSSVERNQYPSPAFGVQLPGLSEGSSLLLRRRHDSGNSEPLQAATTSSPTAFS